MFEKIVIVAVGSGDGILTTSAFLNALGDAVSPQIIFTQPFLVDKIDPASWESTCQVIFIDLAVDNTPGSTKTVDFVRRIEESGHQLVAVIDEHDADAWRRILGKMFNTLQILPQSQAGGFFTSSGKVLESWLKTMGLMFSSPHGYDLCRFADQADRQIFEGIGEIVNKAVKPAIFDNTRREYLARYFANHTEADEKIKGWLAEYTQMEVNHSAIIAEKVDLGNGIWRISSIGKLADATTLFAVCYKEGAKVVALENVMFNKAKNGKTPMLSIATPDKSLDILATLQAAKIPASGFAQKANLELEEEKRALEAIRKLL